VWVSEDLAGRPQPQERLTAEIADVLMKVLKPKGVLVIMEAEHLFLSMRGLRKPGSVTVTTAVRVNPKKSTLKKESLALIKGK
jgi:GTP cyclohydrolase I